MLSSSSVKIMLLIYSVKEPYNFVNEGLTEIVGEDPMGWIMTAERFFVGQKFIPPTRCSGHS
jgi:hypothetical protein